LAANPLRVVPQCPHPDRCTHKKLHNKTMGEGTLGKGFKEAVELPEVEAKIY
jgi:hypothetical protein